MKLEEIESLWEQDKKIDVTKLSEEVFRTINLSDKYQKLFSRETIVLHKLNQEQTLIYKDRWKFYNKLADPKDYQNYQDDGYFDKKVLKKDQDIFLHADQQILNIETKIELQKVKLTYIETILKSLRDRNFQIKNYIEWEKFRAGC